MSDHRDNALRMEKMIAGFRLAVVGLALSALVRAPAFGTAAVITVWCAALAYAAVVLWFEPYRRFRPRLWFVASGSIDYALITLGILVSGGSQSQLYLLYFLFVLSIALRHGFREVIIAGCGTAMGYLGIVLLSAEHWPVALEDAAMQIGYLVIFAVGSAVLAREHHRESRSRAREEALRVALEEVTATVSHDLRNPLDAVSGLLDILMESAPQSWSDEQYDVFARINANVRQMNALVANLLEADLLQRGRQSFHPELVDVNGLIHRVVEAQAHQADLKHIGIVLDLSARLPHAVVDARLIERLVANLMHNAVKFTPEAGAIRISTRHQGSRLSIEIWDSGPTVPAAIQPTLFDKYVRHSSSSGVGLGLYICKSIVDLHGGKIWVQESGDGVAFVAEVPIQAQPFVPSSTTEIHDPAAVYEARVRAWPAPELWDTAS